MEDTSPLTAQGFNEGKGKPLTSQDLRFTVKGETLYATLFDWPEDGFTLIKSLAFDSHLYPREITRVQWLDSGQDLTFEHGPAGLKVFFPEMRPDTVYANVLRIV